MIRLRLLQALEAVVSTGGVTRAAEAIGVTQPAVSRMITELEADVRIALFHRQRGRFELTPHGHRFYQEAVKALAAIQDVDHLARELRSDERRRIRVIAMPGLPAEIVPQAVAAFAPAYPGVRVSLQNSFRTGMEAAIAEGEFDFALATLPMNVPAARITHLATLRAVCVVPRGSRLAARPIIHAEDLRGQNFISQARDALVRRHVDQLFERLGIPRTLEFETQDGAIMLRMVAEGLGVTITHPPFRPAPPGEVVVRPFEPAIPITYGMLRSRTLPREAWMQSFGRILAQQARRALLGAEVPAAAREKRQAAKPPLAEAAASPPA
jgi:DNA-binding transcriptional LysR family regulator